MRKRRNTDSNWRVVVGGLFALGCVLLAGGAGYWRYANQVPVYPAPRVVLPEPNAYDDYVAAGRLCRTAGGSVVRAERPVPSPGSRSRTRAAIGSAAGAGRVTDAPILRKQALIHAYEEGVPLAQVRAVVARNQRALARLRQGFGKEYLNPPVTSFDQTCPELADYEELARVLLVEGKLAEREERPNAAARSYLDCLRFGVDVLEGGGLAHGVTGLHIQNLGLHALMGVTDRLNGAAAATAARAMTRLDARATTVADVLSTEKEWFTAGLLEKLERTRNWHPLATWPNIVYNNLSPFIENLVALRFSFTPKRWIFDDVRSTMDAAIANAHRPYYAPGTPLPEKSYLMWRLFPSRNAFVSAKEWWTKRDAHWRITQARLAARAYQQRYGAPPPSLAALVPNYLAAVPADPYAPQPLVYRSPGDRAIIYSRGPDGDDDGGRDLGMKVHGDSDGDILSLKGLKLH